MNEERSFERFVADHVAAQQGGVPLPDDFFDEMHSFATTTRQRPEWLALIKEPPMRTNSHLAVGSPTVRVAAILIATMLLALALAAAGAAGQRLLAADAAIIVDQSGDGDYTTLAEAVEAADDGDEILIRPGSYTEAIVIDKALTIKGDGPRESIMIGGYQEPERWAAGSECATSEPGACAIVLADTTTALSDVTFSGGHAGLKIIGGAPTVSGVLFDRVGTPESNGKLGLAMMIDASSTARVVGNDFVAGAAIEITGRAEPVIEGNVLSGGSRIIANDPGDAAVIRSNRISDPAASAISVNAPSRLLIEDNEISGAAEDGIRLGLFSGNGLDPTIRHNSIERSGGSGVNAVLGGAPTIEDNTFTDNALGLIVGLGQAQVRSNELSGDGSGITVARGSDPVIRDNTIDVSGIGVTLSDGARGTLSENDVCGAERAIFVHENAASNVDASNQTC
jgi:parallel beta-helix repeat protein